MRPALLLALVGAVLVGAAFITTRSDDTRPDPALVTVSTTDQVLATTTSEPPTTTTAAPADPYERFLQLAPPDAPDLTRDDAQARALLGCGTAWASGTTDHALQVAYVDLIARWEEQGLCQSLG